MKNLTLRLFVFMELSEFYVTANRRKMSTCIQWKVTCSKWHVLSLGACFSNTGSAAEKRRNIAELGVLCMAESGGGGWRQRVTPNTFPPKNNSSHCPDIISTDCQINLHLLVLQI